jgi:hypothetical protein
MFVSKSMRNARGRAWKLDQAATSTILSKGSVRCTATGSIRDVAQWDGRDFENQDFSLGKPRINTT